MARPVYITNEQSTPIYSFQMNDSADDSVVPESSILTLTLTYCNVADDAIINSRNAQDVKDLNAVDLSTSGLVTWGLVVADTTIQDVTSAGPGIGDFELHRALFIWTYTSADGTTKTGNDEINIKIKNLGKVT